MPLEGPIPFLERYDPTTMRLEDWKLLYENYIELADVPDGKRVPVLINALSAPVWRMLTSMCKPLEPKKFTVTQIFDRLATAYKETTNPLLEKANLILIKQKTGESLVDFVNRLRDQVAKCEYTPESVDEQLRIAFLAGVENEATRRHLYSLPKTPAKDFDELFQTALLYEASRKLAKRPNQPADVSAIRGRENVQGGVRGRGNRGGGRAQGGGRGQGGGGRGSFRGAGHNRGTGGRACYCCGSTSHLKAACPLKDQQCRNCGKTGHIAKMCKAPTDRKNRPGQRRTNYIEENFNDVLHMGPVTSSSIFVPLKIDSADISIELDTGSAVTILSKKAWQKIGSPELKPVRATLRCYNGEPIAFMGAADVLAQYRQKSEALRVLVSEEGGCVLGRDWIGPLGLSNLSLRQITQGSVRQLANKGALDRLLEKHRDVFRDEHGCCKNFKAHLYLKEGARPVFCKARPVPFALREEVEKDIERLVKEGILDPIDYSEWAAPIVAVKKEGRRVRVCADLSTGLNASLDVHQYPLPHPDELFAKLSGGVKYSKIDLKEAYAQVLLDDESSKYVVVNTHKGLFRYTRLLFGVASGPSIFQQLIESILQDIEGTAAFLDDIVVTGRTEGEHLENLSKVLQRLDEWGLRVKKEKCVFMSDSVEYLGFIIDKNGRHISQDKTKALMQMPHPENVSQLRSFLGMINHYAKFIPDMSEKCFWFHELLKKDVSWNWSDQCEKYFHQLKEELAQATHLVHFDPKIPLVLAADASKYGIGAVLSHKMSEGTDRPIAHASKSLTSAEKNYGHIEKEALALVFGVKKYHQYLAGREFILLTDHKPLVTIFGSKKGIPEVTVNRLQRWALFLMAYTFVIEYRRTEDFGQADGLSRLPLRSTDLFDTMDMGMGRVVLQVQAEILEDFPVSAVLVARETSRDPELTVVLQYVKDGWPRNISTELVPYSRKKYELTVQSGCVLWGARTVVPAVLRKRILDYLHAAHAGMVRMKSEARSHCWWPGLGSDIEKLAASCEICTRESKDPVKVPLAQWPVPEGAWRRIHIDFAGPFQNEMLFVVVDAYSKWFEVFVMKTITTGATINALGKLFDSYGLPEQIVSDNGTQFTSEEFELFCRKHGIRNIRIAPGHPQSNGQAERYVATVKSGITKGLLDGKTLQKSLREFLARYKTTPHTTTGKTPAELFLGRKPRTVLDLLRPTENAVDQISARERQKKNFDKTSRVRQFVADQLVLVKDFRSHRKHDWVPGRLLEPIGCTMWLVQILDSIPQIWRRHANQIIKRKFLTDEEHFDALQHSTAENSEPARRSEAAPGVPGSDRRGLVAAENRQELRSSEAATLPEVVRSSEAAPGVPVQRQAAETAEENRSRARKREAPSATKEQPKKRQASAADASAGPFRQSARTRKAPDRYGEYVYR